MNLIPARRNPPTWQDRSIELATTGEPIRVDAEVYGPWAVHHQVGSRSGWSITFIPLGMALPLRSVGTKMLGKAIVEEMISQAPELATAKSKGDIEPHVPTIIKIGLSPPKVGSSRGPVSPSLAKKTRRDKIIAFITGNGLRRAGYRSGQGNMEFYVPSILRHSWSGEEAGGTTGSSYAIALGDRDVALKFYRMSGSGEYWVTKDSETQSKITNEKLLSWIELVIGAKSRVERRQS